MNPKDLKQNTCKQGALIQTKISADYNAERIMVSEQDQETVNTILIGMDLKRVSRTTQCGKTLFRFIATKEEMEYLLFMLKEYGIDFDRKALI